MRNTLIIFLISLFLTSAYQVGITSMHRDYVDYPFCTPNCPDGFYSESGYDLDGQGGGCTQCQAGYVSSYNNQECYPCPAGQYPQKLQGHLIQCVYCPSGYYSNPGSASCDISTNECLPGSYNFNGYDIDGQGTGCNQCEQGTFAAKPGSQRCQRCPDGFTSTIGSSFCSIPTKQCPPGTYSQFGYDQDGNGTGCQQCKAGTFTDQQGTTKCTPCPIGYISYEGAISCTIQDKKCPAGTYSETGYEGTIGCYDCQGGYYASDAGSTTCQTCQPGSWSTKNAVSCTIITKQCPQGMFSLQRNGYDIDGNGKGCSLCGPGTYAANKGTSYCTKCPENKWSEQGASSCEINVSLCSPGKYSSTGNDYQGCSDCKEGNYSDSAGAFRCLPCPEGTYQNSQGAVQCIPCAAGTWSKQGSNSCQITTKLCLAGTYSKSGNDQNGHCLGCSQCPRNTYQNKTGSTSCNQCQNNRVSPFGSTQVTDCICPPNFTGPNDGISVCTPLPIPVSNSTMLKYSLVLITLIFFF